MKKKLSLAALALLAGAALSYAVVVFTGTLVNESALAYSKAFVLNLHAHNIHSVSAAAVYSTATVPTSSFQDGSQATGTVTVNNFAALNSARAVNHVTVISPGNMHRAVLALPGYWFQEGLDWRDLATATATAQSIATALRHVAGLQVSVAGNVVYTTAPAPGSLYNSLSLHSSTPTALAVATPFFTGGLDNAVIKINGTTLRAGTDFTAASSNNATASSISTAINAKPALSRWVSASPSTNVVSVLTNYNGAKYNFALYSSTSPALALSGTPTPVPGIPGAAASFMTGGTTPAYAIGSGKISIPSHLLTRALPVLYAQGALIGGLTNQTTYYAIPVDANTIELASSKNNAIAGTFITFTSSTSQTTPDTFSLTPLPFTGVAGFDWEVSNDNVNWNALSVSSITVHAGDSPNNFSWDFGPISLQYLRANVAGPTSGGLQLKIDMVGDSQ